MCGYLAGIPCTRVAHAMYARTAIPRIPFPGLRQFLPLKQWLTHSGVIRHARCKGKGGNSQKNWETTVDIDFTEFNQHDAGPVAAYLLLAVALLMLVLS